MQNTEEIWRLVDARKDDFEALSDRVWGMPELCYGEVRSCAEHTAMLEQQGFRVTRNVAGIPTAVMGEAGDGRPGDRHPRRVRRAARPQPGGRRGRAEAAAGRRLRPWLRPQPAGIGVDAGGDRGEGLPRGARHQGPRALLRLPGGRRRRGQGLHGARRRVQRRGRGDLLASGGVLRRERGGVAGQHAHRLHLPRPRLACRRGAASRAQRARCGGADECRRELHARAHAVGRAHPLRAAGCRRHRAERGAGARQGALSDPRARTAGADAADRAGAQDRRWRGADDRDARGIAGGQRGVEPAGATRRWRGRCTTISSASARRRSTTPIARSRRSSRRR